MKKIRAQDFEAEVLKAPVPVLVDFYTEECGPCRSAAPIIEEIESARAGTLKAVKIDVSAEAAFAASFQISVVPTFLLFYKGERLGQFTGLRSKNDVQRWIDERTVPPSHRVL